jgi:thiamine-monophosphate kinase
MDRAGLKRTSEIERVELIDGVLRRPDTPGVVLAIGDDAAVLAPESEQLVWTVDVQVEHVHFELAWLGWDDLGYRATMAAASDLAAMASRPRGVLASLVLPPAVTDEQLRQLCRGQAQACDELGTALIGGNLSRGTEVSITTTVLGASWRPMPRSGAQAGEQILLAGPVGLAGAGLRLLQRSSQTVPGAPRTHAAAIGAWRRPMARIAEGLRVADLASSAIDLSDGLACDAARIMRASAARGPSLCLVLEAERLVRPELAEIATELGQSPLELALHGGEDYALLVTMPRGEVPSGFVRIGWCEPCEPASARLLLAHADGTRQPVSSHGFDHFAERAGASEPSPWTPAAG